MATVFIVINFLHSESTVFKKKKKSDLFRSALFNGSLLYYGAWLHPALTKLETGVLVLWEAMISSVTSDLGTSTSTSCFF